MSPSDTRPIAHLCELSKIFERVIHSQITTFVDENNLLDPRQSGYRKFFSTQAALLKLCHEIRLGVDNRKITILVLFDFSKAFDTIGHLVLLTKLRRYGFSDGVLRWLYSYLNGRSQAVVGDLGSQSGWLCTSSGVPQGSVLGPLLFSLFINDIAANLVYTQHLIYADDTQIFLSCSPSDIVSALAKVSHDVNVIASYAAVNGLKLNLNKSKILILGSGTYINRIDLNSLPSISVNGTVIPYVSEVRNLGVIMSSNLSWRSQVMSISRRVNGALYALKFHRNALSTELRSLLVRSLIFPLVDYCCLVYNDLSGELNLVLQRLINSAIRFVFDLRWDEHITPYRRQLGWLSVRCRRLYFLGILLFHIHCGSAPAYLCELFVKTGGQNDRSLRTSEFYHIPAHRTATYHNSFHLCGLYLWNSLPQEITSSSSVAIFKTKLFAHLFASDTGST